jgi:hypothetical protein
MSRFDESDSVQREADAFAGSPFLARIALGFVVAVSASIAGVVLAWAIVLPFTEF